jgi:hypothetical protein
MKQRLTFLSICAALLFAGAFFTSCTSTTTPPTTTTTAYTDTYADVTGLSDGHQYSFSVTSSNAGTVISGVSSYANGIVRVFWNRAVGDSSQVTVNHVDGGSSSATSIVWAPADFTSAVRLWETSDPNASHPSGLILGATSTSTSVSGSSKQDIDLVLATDASVTAVFPFLKLEAADQTSISNARATDLSQVAYQVKGGLAMNHFNSDLSGIIPTGSNSVGFFSFSDWATIVDTSIIIPVLTADNHFARVEIIPQSTSPFKVWGDTDPGQSDSKRFIDVNVTYQTHPGWAFAGRPGEVRRGTNTHRLRGGLPVIQ